MKQLTVKDLKKFLKNKPDEMPTKIPCILIEPMKD